MINKAIAQLIKSAPILSEDDTIRRAVGLIRAVNADSILVMRHGQLAGSVSERGITAFLSTSDDPEGALELPIEELIEPDIVLVNRDTTLKQAAEIFTARNVDTLPVIDNYGIYLGVIYRRDVIGLLTKNLRPPSVAGMATPLGVYLTTGSHRAGAGSLGLFLTGASLMTMITIASLIVKGLQLLIEKLTGFPVSAYVNSPPLTMSPSIYDLPFYISTILTIVIMLSLLRFSPLSGYHAAEHMTVHAIEAGEELSPGVVKHMPRVHPRCGTNLLASASVFLIIVTKFNGEFAVLLAMVVVFLGWRSYGALLQSLVTTKPPSERQLKNGVAAGNELLELYMEKPNYQSVGFERIYNMGFLQTAAGMTAVFGVLYILQNYLHIPVLL